MYPSLQHNAPLYMIIDSYHCMYDDDDSYSGDGIWGDHLELQAASSLFHVHIAVHQIGGIVRIENSHITSREYSDAIKRARTLWHHRIHTSTTSSSLTPSTSQVSESKTMSDTKRSDPDDMKSSTASSASSGPASSDDAILSPLLRAAATRAFARVLHVSYHRRQHYNRYTIPDSTMYGIITHL